MKHVFSDDSQAGIHEFNHVGPREKPMFNAQATMLPFRFPQKNAIIYTTLRRSEMIAIMCDRIRRGVNEYLNFNLGTS